MVIGAIFPGVSIILMNELDAAPARTCTWSALAVRRGLVRGLALPGDRAGQVALARACEGRGVRPSQRLLPSEMVRRPSLGPEPRRARPALLDDLPGPLVSPARGQARPPRRGLDGVVHLARPPDDRRRGVHRRRRLARRGAGRGRPGHGRRDPGRPPRLRRQQRPAPARRRGRRERPDRLPLGPAGRPGRLGTGDRLARLAGRLPPAAAGEHGLRRQPHVQPHAVALAPARRDRVLPGDAPVDPLPRS